MSSGSCDDAMHDCTLSDKRQTSPPSTAAPARKHVFVNSLELPSVMKRFPHGRSCVCRIHLPTAFGQSAPATPELCSNHSLQRYFNGLEEITIDARMPCTLPEMPRNID